MSLIWCGADSVNHAERNLPEMRWIGEVESHLLPGLSPGVHASLSRRARHGHVFLGKNGASGRTRTCNLLIRSCKKPFRTLKNRENIVEATVSNLQQRYQNRNQSFIAPMPLLSSPRKRRPRLLGLFPLP